MRRGVEEDVARSHLRLGQLDRALECAKNVVDLAQNMEQVTAVLHLLLDIYKAAGSTAEMLCTVKKLLLLHPNNSGFWTQLGDLHSSASSSDSVVQASDASCSSQTIHTRVNGVVGRVKHCCHIRENSQTTPDGELRSITVRRTVEACDKLITNESLAPNPPPEDSSISNATRTVCDCSQRGQIVSARDSDCLFDPLLDQFESMSCDGTSPRQVTGERDRLVICLTCFVAARLLLTSVHCRLNSFARAKNEQDQLKVESRLDSLLAQSDLEKQLLECSEFLKVALNVAEPDESIASTNRICDMTPCEVLCEDERSTTAFDRKWFSWMKNDVSSQDQFEH